MSARTVTAYAIQCDLCDSMSPVATTPEVAVANANVVGFITWPRPHKHLCAQCDAEISTPLETLAGKASGKESKT